MKVDRRSLLVGLALLVGGGGWASPGPDRPRLFWSAPAELAGADDDVLAPLALCDVVAGSADPVLIEPDGSWRTVRLAGLGVGEVGARLRALILPDGSAIRRYAAARRGPDPALELALSAAEGSLSPEAVDAVLANLVRARLER